MIAKSVIEAEGTQGTTINNLGGVGIGFKYEGKIYRSGGNGFYYDETSEIRRFIADKGQSYLKAVKDFSFGRELVKNS